MMGGEQHKEETVDELLAKLAKKGKKVKLLDETATAKESNPIENFDDATDLVQEGQQAEESSENKLGE